jgi:hypothetical protein
MVHHRRSLTRQYLPPSNNSFGPGRGWCFHFRLVAGGANCRSLGFARDDKKERAVARRGRSLKGRAVTKGSTPTPTTALSLGNDPLFTTTLSFLSSRADDLACGEVMKSMNKTRPKFAVDSIWFNILYIGSEAEGSAVPRTFPGNVFFPDVTFVSREKRNVATLRFLQPAPRW